MPRRGAARRGMRVRCRRLLRRGARFAECSMGGRSFFVMRFMRTYWRITTSRHSDPAPRRLRVSVSLRKRTTTFPGRRLHFCGLRTEPAAEGTERPSGETLRGPSDRRDGALRDLVVGLLRCISRLVATLREGGTEVLEEAVGEVDGKGDGDGDGDVDVLLLRALCEIVRCSEER